MSIKTALRRKVMRHLFSIRRRDSMRRKAEQRRRSQNAPHVVEYFHEVGAPYSHLMVQLLPEFCQRYDAELKVHIVSPPPDWAAPDRPRLEAYARQDAARLAKKAGVEYTDPGRQPSQELLDTANAALIAAVGEGKFIERAADIGRRLWSGELAVQPDVSVTEQLTEAGRRRDELGHYLGATVFYAGEWYWGPDRLHYLEARLSELGAGIGNKQAGLIFAPPSVSSEKVVATEGQRPELHWYLSFRSPYTGIVADRVKALADAYGADLKLRYVLPMVMRGMQVPRMKGFYIMRDTVREAERLGVPFGKICDPVGQPVERGYAILHRAIESGQGFEFARSFLSGVWSEGIDAGSDRGLKTITERAGLSWAEVKPLLEQDQWRADAEANQAEMFSYGVWGVPSFRVGETAVWGQDRLWVIEDALAAATSAETQKIEG